MKQIFLVLLRRSFGGQAGRMAFGGNAFLCYGGFQVESGNPKIPNKNWPRKTARLPKRCIVAAASHAASYWHQGPFLREKMARSQVVLEGKTVVTLRIAKYNLEMSNSYDDQVPHFKNAKKSSFRKHLRLRNHDYRENGYYFVTICTRERKPLFGSEKAKSLLQEKINQMPRFFPGVTIDQAVVMPNHLHVILLFQSSDKSLGQVIQAFKSWVTREWGLGHSIWQPNYYEHVIRNEKALHQVREYIVNNPLIDQINCEQFYE